LAHWQIVRFNKDVKGEYVEKIEVNKDYRHEVEVVLLCKEIEHSSTSYTE
jgi:hypothetical protein